MRYCVSFDARWRYVFVDSVVSADAAGLPDFESIIGRCVRLEATALVCPSLHSMLECWAIVSSI